MCSPRQDCLGKMICNLSDAGFETGFTSLYWAYASGFPKAQNIGKAVDKRGGVSVSWFGEWLKKWRLEKGITQKEIAKLFPSKTGGLTGCVANWEIGYNMPTPKEFTTICRHFNLPFENIEEAEREVLGENPHYCEGRKIDPEINAVGSQMPAQPKYLTGASSPQAKALDGSYGGFQPKPAVEVILVAMKPLSEKTFVDQALKNRKGISWLDDGRIPYKSEDLESRKQRDGLNAISKEYEGRLFGREKAKICTDYSGRFPANLLVSDDVLNDGRITKSGYMEGKHIAPNSYGGFNTPTETMTYPDSGSFSRYFDLDKWAQKTFPFLIVPKASKSEKNKGLEGLPKRPVAERAGRDNTINSKYTPEGKLQSISPPESNNHPTVKPLKLMSYLITLGSREGDTILDPFVGSGTTCLAAKLLGRKSIGYEINEAYCEIAANRCVQGIFEF